MSNTTTNLRYSQLSGTKLRLILLTNLERCSSTDIYKPSTTTTITNIKQTKFQSELRLEQLRTLWNTLTVNRPATSLEKKRTSHALSAIQTELLPLYPQKQIPNVRRFKVEVLSNYHPILIQGGVKKREYEPLFSTEPYRNNRINSYIRHQFRRLNQHRSNPRVFWRISEHLINRSSSFASLMLFETFPGWHRKMDYGEIWELIKSFRSLNLQKYTHYTKAIPKPDGSYRYLGIPSPAWRLYLHGIQRFLQVWLHPFTHPHQHGFTPHKGTGTAWKQIHNEVISSPDVYEYDLKKFFDTINLDYLSNLLKNLQIPTPLVNKLIHWSRTPSSNSKYSIHTWSNPHEESQDYKYHQTGEYTIWSEEESHHWLEEKRKAEETNPLLRRYDYYHGVAQGSPTSPLLSTIILNKLLLVTDRCQVVQYADDGLLYDLKSLPEDILTFPPESGITVHWGKSRWIKRNGHWLTPLNFLGLTFDATTSKTSPTLSQGGELRNNTRTKKEYTFDSYALFERAHEYDQTKVVSPPQSEESNFEAWFKTKYHDFIMSRLYLGQLEIDTIKQDFTYSYRCGSWADLENQRRTQIPYYRYDPEGRLITLDIFNSSSFAHHSLANRINRTLPPRRLTGFRY